MAQYSDLKIRLQPGAKKDLLCCWMENGDLKIKIREKPIEGKANKYLIKYLSKLLKIKRNEIEFIFGEKSRKKCIRFHGIEINELKAKINELINQDP